MKKSTVNGHLPTKLTSLVEEMYRKRCKIVEEMGRLRKLIVNMEELRDDLDTRLARSFSNGSRRLQDGTIVERTLIEVEERICTKEMVGTILTRGYSYPHYSEMASPARV